MRQNNPIHSRRKGDFMLVMRLNDLGAITRSAWLRLIDKAAEAGWQVLLVNPAYTSQTCSSYGGLFPPSYRLQTVG